MVCRRREKGIAARTSGRIARAKNRDALSFLCTKGFSAEARKGGFRRKGLIQAGRGLMIGSTKLTPSIFYFIVLRGLYILGEEGKTSGKVGGEIRRRRGGKRGSVLDEKTKGIREK